MTSMRHGVFRLVLVLAAWHTAGVAWAAAPPCREPRGTRIWWSPLSPAAKSPLRLLVVSENPQQGDVHVTLPGQSRQKLPTSVRGGPPWSFAAEIRPAAPGNLRVELVRDGETIA